MAFVTVTWLVAVALATPVSTVAMAIGSVAMGFTTAVTAVATVATSILPQTCETLMGFLPAPLGIGGPIGA